MKNLSYILLIITLILIGWKQPGGWLKKDTGEFTFCYTSADARHLKEYLQLISTGMDSVKKFFGNDYQTAFYVYDYPTRAGLDSAWQHVWKLPDFKSGCWMVASGVASRVDMISPAAWKTEACEHDYADKRKTQQLITHELVHVYHGQLNASKDFSDVDNIDWFVEGLATYASGQYDAERAAEVKAAVVANTAPATLDSFWTGNLKYGLSGSIVMYIDKKYGREKLNALLPYNKKQQILQALNVTEGNLIAEWKVFVVCKN